MPTLTIIRGLPGSGKSTLARKIAAETGAIHIEPDMFCMQDGEYKYAPEKYGKAFDNARAIISRLAYNMECDIIFADVLPQTAQVDSFRYLIPSNYKLVVKDLHISKEESLQRNKHHVRPEDIENMAAAWQSWRRGETVTDCNHLPKLTAEVFDRPDCPIWAKYAAMDIDGTVCYFEDISRKNHYTEFIRRPKKKKGELPKGRPLPDWVEVGAYAYIGGKYRKITSIDTEGYSSPLVIFDDNADRCIYGSLRWDDVKKARLVPWTGDLSFCVGKVFKYGDYTLLCVACKGDSVCFIGNIHVSNEIIKAGCERTAKELFEHGFTFADGSLCGEFEHLEYDPIDECFDWVN